MSTTNTNNNNNNNTKSWNNGSSSGGIEQPSSSSSSSRSNNNNNNNHTTTRLVLRPAPSPPPLPSFARVILPSNYHIPRKKDSENKKKDSIMMPPDDDSSSPPPRAPAVAPTSALEEQPPVPPALIDKTPPPLRLAVPQLQSTATTTTTREDAPIPSSPHHQHLEEKNRRSTDGSRCSDNDKKATVTSTSTSISSTSATTTASQVLLAPRILHGATLVTKTATTCPSSATTLDGDGGNHKIATIDNKTPVAHVKQQEQSRTRILISSSRTSNSGTTRSGRVDTSSLSIPVPVPVAHLLIVKQQQTDKQQEKQPPTSTTPPRETEEEEEKTTQQASPSNQSKIKNCSSSSPDHSQVRTEGVLAAEVKTSEKENANAGGSSSPVVQHDAPVPVVPQGQEQPLLVVDRVPPLRGKTLTSLQQHHQRQQARSNSTNNTTTATRELRPRAQLSAFGVSRGSPPAATRGALRVRKSSTALASAAGTAARKIRNDTMSRGDSARMLLSIKEPSSSSRGKSIEAAPVPVPSPTSAASVVNKGMNPNNRPFQRNLEYMVALHGFITEATQSEHYRKVLRWSDNGEAFYAESRSGQARVRSLIPKYFSNNPLFASIIRRFRHNGGQFLEERRWYHHPCFHRDDNRAETLSKVTKHDLGADDHPRNITPCEYQSPQWSSSVVVGGKHQLAPFHHKNDDTTSWHPSVPPFKKLKTTASIGKEPNPWRRATTVTPFVEKDYSLGCSKRIANEANTTFVAGCTSYSGTATAGETGATAASAAADTHHYSFEPVVQRDEDSSLFLTPFVASELPPPNKNMSNSLVLMTAIQPVSAVKLSIPNGQVLASPLDPSALLAGALPSRQQQQTILQAAAPDSSTCPITVSSDFAVSPFAAGASTKNTTITATKANVVASAPRALVVQAQQPTWVYTTPLSNNAQKPSSSSSYRRIFSGDYSSTFTPARSDSPPVSMGIFWTPPPQTLVVNLARKLDDDDDDEEEEDKSSSSSAHTSTNHHRVLDQDLLDDFSVTSVVAV